MHCEPCIELTCGWDCGQERSGVFVHFKADVAVQDVYLLQQVVKNLK
jgi:hypothetical protein